MVNPVTTALGFAQLGLDFFNNKRQQNLAALNLFETQRSNREKERLAKADREDAFGNTVRFDGTGFRTDLDPLVAAIVEAQKRENLTNLTEDAGRSRAARERSDDRSIEADKLFQELFSEFSGRRRPSEEEVTAETIQDVLNVRNSTSPELDGLSRVAARSGDRNLAREVAEASRNPEQSLAAALVGAKSAGRSRYASERSTRVNAELNELLRVLGIADNAPQTAATSNAPIATDPDRALGELLQTIAGNSAATQSANRALSAAQKPLDIRSLGSLLEGLFQGGTEDGFASSDDNGLIGDKVYGPFYGGPNDNLPPIY